MNVNDAFGRAKSETDKKPGMILEVLGRTWQAKAIVSDILGVQNHSVCSLPTDCQGHSNGLVMILIAVTFVIDPRPKRPYIQCTIYMS